MKELDGFTDDEKIISQAVTKICSSFGYIQMFPAESKTWLIEEASKGVSGMLAFIYKNSIKKDTSKTRFSECACQTPLLFTEWSLDKE